ncbi:MAG: hypothetical protein HY048_15170 [Acidobacteria bacterium]|nr:hypothetical protein [Acidobacteriota bacterium]
MAAEKWRPWILAALALALTWGVYRAWPATSAPAAATSNAIATPPAAQTAAPRTQQAAATPSAPDVHLAALSGDRVRPVDEERNLFRFKPKPVPPPPPAPVRPTGPVTPVPTGPPPVPPPPPITLKFIGLFDTGEQKPKIAILSDSAGHVFYGTEGGPPIEGRYRIVKIGAESIEMSYLDGRGRTTLRLSGS